MAIAFYLLPVAFGFQVVTSLFVSRGTTSLMLTDGAANIPHELPLSELIPVPGMIEPTVPADIVLPLIGLWGFGVVAFAGWQMYCYRKFTRTLHRTRTVVPDSHEAFQQLALMKKTLGIQTHVQLAHSSKIPRNPVLVGLWQPTIYLPMEHANVDLSMVIHHKLIHLKRKDLWVKAMILAASALHWFNPFVHLLWKEIHTWSELSCDEVVVKDMSPAERKRHGETILHVMIGSRNTPVQFSASLSGDGKQLIRRLTMMLNVRKLKTSTVVLTSAALIAAGAAGTSAAVWACQHSLHIERTIVYKDVGDTVLYNGVPFLKFGALTPDEQQFVIEEQFVGQIYAIEGYDEPVPKDELTNEEQRQVTIEEGYFSRGSIAVLKEFREKYPRGETVTHTHEDDPSILLGMSVTIRDMTPDEIASL